MAQAISISAVFGMFSIIAMLGFGLSIVGIVDSSLNGDPEQVNEHAEEIEEYMISEIESLPYEPIIPYVFGGIAVFLSSLCGLLGIPLIFRR